MRSCARTTLVAVLVVLAACRDASRPLQPGQKPSQDLALTPGNTQVIPGQYIVVFKDGVADPDGLAQSLVSLYGGSLKHTYFLHAGSTHKKVYLTAVSFSSVQVGTLKIVVSSSGKPVIIDGLAVSAV